MADKKRIKLKVEDAISVDDETRKLVTVHVSKLRPQSVDDAVVTADEREKKG